MSAWFIAYCLSLPLASYSLGYAIGKGMALADWVIKRGPHADDEMFMRHCAACGLKISGTDSQFVINFMNGHMEKHRPNLTKEN